MWERRGWILAAVAGWAAVASIWTVDVGFQLASAGEPVRKAVPSTLVAIAPGVALTPLVFLAFHRFVAPVPGAWTRAVRYVGVGAAFWVLWSAALALVGQSGLVPAAVEEASLGTVLFRRLAGLSFNSALLFSVMAVLHEAVLQLREAERQEVRTSRLQLELDRARGAALQAQLNPHFLFNTLHVASGLSDSDVPAAQGVLRDLGALLRESLAGSEAQLVPLESEIRLVRRYSGIQKARFGDRLEVEIRIDPDTERLRVPPLLLQPLVENAVLHGVADREEGGRIEITAARDGGRLRLAVVDSGSGFPGRSETPSRERLGIGGTRARLDLLFGDAGALRFSYPPEGGFRVEVTLPEIEGGAP